jgi:aspartyl-tRNA(Asn)/glutamyl-tRNA(Gln) amidotransferase subunit B
VSSDPATRYETVIGIEVHVQLRTDSKMFCGCSTRFGAPPNTQVCPVCLGLPGALPVPNREAVQLALKAALSLGCRINVRSEFVRKNYFYPDLPKGYQITQLAYPLAHDGRVDLWDGGHEVGVRIRRLHMEEDAGKSLHDRFSGLTAVDLNRAGVPLIEIVTEPDLGSPAEARAYLSRLKQILEHFAEVSDCNMEEGSLRVDANLSVRPAGTEPLGQKTEVKNLNSFSNVEKALAHERDRQIALLERGEAVSAETRLYDAGRGETRPMRGKEEDFDYRFFPEPDLPILEVDAGRVEAVRAGLPEMPHALEQRLVREYGLTAYDASLLSANPARAAFFEDVADGRDGEYAKVTANFMMGEVAKELNRRGDGEREVDVISPSSLGRVVELRLDGTLSAGTAARALEILMSDGGDDVDAIVEAHDLAQVQDDAQLIAWVEGALAEHPEEVARYRTGEEKLFGFLVGSVMRRAGGKADPARARALILERLKNDA